MARYKVTAVVQVVDVNGDTALVEANFSHADTVTIAQLATDVGNLATAVAQASNGKITRQSVKLLINEAQFIVGTAPPTNASYPSVTDGARFQFADGAGERASLTIPAPIEALFGAGSNVIDSTQTNSAAVIAYATANLTDLAGTALNLYKGGIKVGKRARRRRSALLP